MPQQLQLQELLGQGSFGSVFLALWRGKRVAVKVMQLPAAALLNPGEQLTSEHNAQSTQQGQDVQQQQLDEPAQERRRRLQRQKQQNSPPHMAIMEAVVSSTMCHPNVSAVA
jgi:serine/threonine protein kinase